MQLSRCSLRIIGRFPKSFLLAWPLIMTWLHRLTHLRKKCFGQALSLSMGVPSRWWQMMTQYICSSKYIFQVWPIDWFWSSSIFGHIFSKLKIRKIDTEYMWLYITRRQYFQECNPPWIPHVEKHSRTVIRGSKHCHRRTLFRQLHFGYTGRWANCISAGFWRVGRLFA